MSWFLEGTDQAAREKFVKEAYRPSIFNFWMKEGETREMVFLDDARFGVYEHVIPMNGTFKNFTCAGNECVLCGLEKPRGYREYYNILDLTPYTSKDGKEKKFSHKALAATKDVSAILQSRRADHGGTLAALKFKVSRNGAKSPACGNDFVFQSKVDLTKVPSDIKLYDFREVLRPRPTSEIQAMLSFGGGGDTKTVSRSSLTAGMDQSAPAGMDDIPF